MKKRGIEPYLLMVVAMLIFYSSNAQQQPKHEKTIYQKDDGTVYWNKHLPFFIRLSTSESGADSYLLNRDSTDAKDGSMYFDTEGRNWVRTRWEVDMETGKSKYPQKEVLWPIEADGIAPETKPTYNYTGRHIREGKTYYSGDVTVTLKADDEVSGVDKIYFSDGTTFKEYKEPIKLDAEKDWTLKFYAVDKVGNAESAEKTSKTLFSFFVDKSAPKTTLIASDPKLDDIMSPKTKFKLESSDDAAGVMRSYYTIDNAKEKIFDGEIDLLSLEDGEHTIKFYSIDHVDNKEDIHSFTFYLDKIAPEVAFSIDGDQFSNSSNQTFVSERSKLVLTSTDNHSGVDNVFWGVDGKEKAAYTNPLAVDQGAGYHYLSYYGIDKVENKGREQRQVFLVDTKAPVIQYKMKGPNFERRDTIFVRSITSFTVNPYERGKLQSGVKEILYTSEKGENAKFSEAFTLKKDGLHKLTITVSDHVNNSANETDILFIDNKAPEIFHHFSVEKIGSKKVRNEEFVIYPREVQVYLAATDEHAGTDKIYYSINGGPEKLYGTPIQYLKANQNFTIDVRSVDLLGNESKTKFSFSVEN